MRSLKSFRANGSSILESVIAITVISICVLVFFTIYTRVVQGSDIQQYQKAVFAVDRFVQQKRFGSGEEVRIDLNQKGYRIQSEVLEKHRYSCLVEFTIKINTRKYTVIRNVKLNNE